MIKILKTIGIVCLIAFFSCDSAKDNEDMEATRIEFLFLLYLVNSENFQAKCLEAQSSALSCANNASLVSAYILAIESRFQISIAHPQSNVEICESMNASASFRSFSNGARSCSFQCQKGYWDSGQSGGNCTFTNYVQFLANSASSINTCFEDCLRGSTQFVF